MRFHMKGFTSTFREGKELTVTFTAINDSEKKSKAFTATVYSASQSGYSIPRTGKTLTTVKMPAIAPKEQAVVEKNVKLNTGAGIHEYIYVVARDQDGKLLATRGMMRTR